MSLMASPSSFPSRNYKFDVFSSFHGPDVRKTHLSHMREQFNRNGITMFNDQEIERSATIAPSLKEAIKESRISIVILSKKYASSSWCLDELVEILKCKEAMGQIVMTIFYGVEPSDVRKQTGEFGIAFNETCELKTDEERQKWTKALNDVGNIAGEDFKNWDNEANMIKKLASDVSDKLNATPSFPSSNYKFNVFSSFHGPDVRKTLLSHMRVQFKRNGINMFDDQEIVRSTTIAPSLTEAIKESRISIVILSKKYASSSWCLDELVEILKCKEAMGQIVMTIFYGVEPSDVRKQTGEFGIAFNETCAHKTDEEMQKWSKALKYVGNIAGEDFKNWDNEANMIKKLASDVSEKLNATPSRDFEDMVGIEAHLQIMQSLLHLDNKDEAMIAGISGPAGIGKTTIARALQSLLSDKFQLTCFVDNIRGSYHSGLDDYGLQLRLQEDLLSKVFNQDGTRICHLGVLQQRLSDLRVLIILDDVDDLKQLEALANETAWFGSGSRIVVTTENKELLQQHGINNTYHVGFPSDEEALEILCRYAFRQGFPPHGFEKLAKSITHLCGNLPLGLRVVGSSLRGKNEEGEWEYVMHKLETVLDRKIGDVLRVSYESLDEDEQTLFLHIAVFFNYGDGDLVKTMFADSDLDVKRGLKILVNRSLIEMPTYGESIVMHRLLQQVGRDATRKQEPWKRKILMDAHEICDVLENETGTRVVSGISFGISRIDEVSIGNKAFKRMPNLRFLRVYKSKEDGNHMIHIPEEMEFPCRLRLLQWDAYPNKCLPPRFHPEYLVKLDMQSSQLEYLWQGTQPLTNLKKIDLCGSSKLKELPDLSNATKLEKLVLDHCESLVEIPSSFPHVHKLHDLWVRNCINLQVIPAHLELASIDLVWMSKCSKLRNFPLISTHIRDLSISKTAVEDPPASTKLNLSSSGKLKGLTKLNLSPTSSMKIHLFHLDLRYTDIERIPDCIKALHSLHTLHLSGCRRLTSLPELPSSLGKLNANDCESLEMVFFPLNIPNARLCFTNCFKLDQQTQREIIQRSLHSTIASTLLPGREVPAEFDHRARGNSLTIRLDGNMPLYIIQRWLRYGNTWLPGREEPAEFDHRARGNSVNIRLNGNRSPYIKFCLVISPNNQINDGNRPMKRRYLKVQCCRIVNGDLEPNDEVLYGNHFSKCRTEHLFIFNYFNWDEVSSDLVFEFRSKDLDIVECGAQIGRNL